MVERNKLRERERERENERVERDREKDWACVEARNEWKDLQEIIVKEP